MWEETFSVYKRSKLYHHAHVPAESITNAWGGDQTRAQRTGRIGLQLYLCFCSFFITNRAKNKVWVYVFSCRDLFVSEESVKKQKFVQKLYFCNFYDWNPTAMFFSEGFLFSLWVLTVNCLQSVHFFTEPSLNASRPIRFQLCLLLFFNFLSVPPNSHQTHDGSKTNPSVTLYFMAPYFSNNLM